MLKAFQKKLNFKNTYYSQPVNTAAILFNLSVGVKAHFLYLFQYPEAKLLFYSQAQDTLGSKLAMRKSGLMKATIYKLISADFASRFMSPSPRHVVIPAWPMY